MKDNIVIATIKSWNIDNFLILKNKLLNSYNINLISNKDDLNLKYIEELNPKYIFFPHWSWIIPENIYSNFECIVFHMTDLPFGRGGSPLQNLIYRDIEYTKISAIKVEKGIDTGRVYIKEDLFIGLGNADEIFEKASNIIFNKMIPNILENNITPIDQ
ncbi:MAG: methionyl-tRNA formyltransferase, partial [Candidatus Sericytochromatia bacterium]